MVRAPFVVRQVAQLRRRSPCDAAVLRGMVTSWTLAWTAPSYSTPVTCRAVDRVYTDHTLSACESRAPIDGADLLGGAAPESSASSTRLISSLGSASVLRRCVSTRRSAWVSPQGVTFSSGRDNRLWVTSDDLPQVVVALPGGASTLFPNSRVRQSVLSRAEIDARRRTAVANGWRLCYTFGGHQVKHKQTEASPLTTVNQSGGGASTFRDAVCVVGVAVNSVPDGGGRRLWRIDTVTGE